MPKSPRSVHAIGLATDNGFYVVSKEVNFIELFSELYILETDFFHCYYPNALKGLNVRHAIMLLKFPFPDFPFFENKITKIRMPSKTPNYILQKVYMATKYGTNWLRSENHFPKKSD